MLKKLKLSNLSMVDQVIILSGGYIAIQMMSDIAATKVITLGPLVMDAGIIYSFTFTWRDLIHKRLGARSARTAIVLAGIVNLVMAGYFQFVVQLPAETEWAALGGQEAWSFIFGLVPRIVLASIAAEIVSELIDTEVYSFWVKHQQRLPQWTRVAASNAVSIPLDSAIFVLAAFGGVLSFDVLFAIFISNIATKIILSIPSFWTIYLVKGREETTKN